MAETTAKQELLPVVTEFADQLKPPMTCSTPDMESPAETTKKKKKEMTWAELNAMSRMDAEMRNSAKFQDIK